MFKEKIVGIYCITNKINNKKYIGLSRNIYKRWTQHKQHALYYKSYKNYALYKALNKYGIDNFSWEILEKCDNNISKSELLQKELNYINIHNSFIHGYNIANKYDTLSNNDNKINIGKKISEKKKEKNNKWINNGKISKCIEYVKLNEYLNNGWQLGRMLFSDEHKNEISTVLKNKWKNGYTHKIEALEIMKNTFKGKKHTDEIRKKMSINSKGKYTLEWFINKYGKTLGNIKYKEKCEKLKNRKLPSGLSWFIARYGEINGLKYFKHKQENMKNRYSYLWVNNGVDMIIIKKKQKEQYINIGWNLGMLKPNK